MIPSAWKPPFRKASVTTFKSNNSSNLHCYIITFIQESAIFRRDGLNNNRYPYKKRSRNICNYAWQGIKFCYTFRYSNIPTEDLATLMVYTKL